MKKQPKPLTISLFCQRHKISLSQLAEICGDDASKTTMHRLLHEQLDAEFTAKLRKNLAVNLPQFLFNLGLSAAEIDNQLTQIFDKGEYQSMITQKTVLPSKVVGFFGLTGDPFSTTPQSRSEVFQNPALKDVVNQVIDGIKYHEFKYVSGDIGSGKSIVRLLVEDQISQSNLRLIFPETFDMSRVSSANISRAILEEFDVKHIPNDSVARAKKVKNVLKHAHSEGIRVAIGFDECHRLHDETISSLKNFQEMNKEVYKKYLGVILFGQPSFETRLGEPKFSEIFQRITPIKMPSFRESAFDYLIHRIALVGGDIYKIFDQDAIDLICQHGETPLALGNIANSAMKISCEVFNNQQVIGAAIRTKMFFAEAREPKQFSRRAKA